MQLNELHGFKLSDAVHFHNELNPYLFHGDQMIPEVRKQLMLIADDFIQHLGIDDFLIDDVTISGSNAAYSYTKHSDIDLHIVVDMSKFNNDDVYRELFDAKKTVYNEDHDIMLNGYTVEVYVQDKSQPHISLGEYSIMNDKWNRLPSKKRAHFDETASRVKYDKLLKLIEYALKTESIEKLQNILSKIKKYRQAGLSYNGEFGPENLAYKALRSQGVITELYAKLDELHSKQLSLPEDQEFYEASGYIPSIKEKNDPRFKTALTVDITPFTMQQNAKKLGSKISRAGIPPLLKP